MAVKKTDARVRYTKLMIRNSFVALLKEKPLAKVTVTEICANAGINRATFYAHYKDPSDLMNCLENELLENIVDILNESISSGEEELRRILPIILNFMKSEADICTVLMSDLSSGSFVNSCLELIKSRFVSHWTNHSSLTERLADRLFTYGAMGRVGILTQWLTEGCQETPEYMAELIIRLFNSGASSFQL